MRLGIGDPDKKDLMSVRACFGLWRGTSCPAPLTDTKVSPSYSCVQPPTCVDHHVLKKIGEKRNHMWIMLKVPIFSY